GCFALALATQLITNTEFGTQPCRNHLGTADRLIGATQYPLTRLGIADLHVEYTVLDRPFDLHVSPGGQAAAAQGQGNQGHCFHGALLAIWIARAYDRLMTIV